MPTTYSGRSAVVGFGRQTAEGSPLAAPVYEIPMGDGGMVGPERSDADLPWTNDSQDRLGGYVERINGVVDAPLPVLPISSVPLFHALLGARATSGAGADKTHVLTPADTTPFLTWFYAQPGGNFHTVADAKLASGELRWSAGGPLELGVNGMGKAVPTRAGSKWGAPTLVEGVDPFFTYIGATMNFEAGSTPATTRVRNIGGGTVGINRNTSGIQTDDVTYGYLPEGMREISIDLTGVVMENQDLINTIFYGSASGTEATSSIAYGSVDFTFKGSDQAAAATRSLRVTLPRVKWMMDRVPSSSTGGDPVTYDVSGVAYKPASGAIITVTIINQDAGTNY